MRTCEASGVPQKRHSIDLLVCLLLGCYADHARRRRTAAGPYPPAFCTRSARGMIGVDPIEKPVDRLGQREHLGVRRLPGCRTGQMSGEGFRLSILYIRVVPHESALCLFSDLRHPKLRLTFHILSRSFRVPYLESARYMENRWQQVIQSGRYQSLSRLSRASCRRAEYLA